MSEENPFRECKISEAHAMATRQRQFLEGVAEERKRQDARWGTNVVGADRMIVVLAEEFGEIARALLERDKVGMEKELIQTAAVCSKLFELLTIQEVDTQAFASRGDK